MSDSDISVGLQSYDLQDIMRCIKHRYPMLLIDRVIDLDAGKSATGIKAVTSCEPYFQGHFPDFPVMPGVLIVEAMAQTAAVMVVSALGQEFEGNNVFFMGIKDAKFRSMVVPGDVLHLKVNSLQSSRRQDRLFWRVDAKAYVNEVLVTEAVLTAMIEA